MKRFSGGKEVQAFKTINIRVFSEHNQGSNLFRYHARRGMAFSQDEIDGYLERVADQVEKRFPQFEYSLVPLGQAHFNFVWKGYRAAQARQMPAGA